MKGESSALSRIDMTVITESGRTITIHSHHTLFEPAGHYLSGDSIDPSTVDVTPLSPTELRHGHRLIIDNVVEVVAEIIS